MVILVRERACFRRERREDLVISPVKDRRAQDEPPQRPQETAAITGKRPIEDQDGGPENGGDEPPGVAWPILPWSLFHIEVTFEVVVFCVFRELSQGAQAKWVTTVLCKMQQCAGIPIPQWPKTAALRRLPSLIRVVLLVADLLRCNGMAVAEPNH